MFRCFCVATAFVLFTALATYGESQPVPNKGGSEQKSSDTQNGTADNPFIVKIMPDSQPQDKIDAENEEKTQKALMDKRLVDLTGDLVFYTKILAIVTGVLASITGILVFVGVCQARVASKATNEAREATKIARRNLEMVPQIERAYVSGGGGREVLDEILQNLPMDLAPQAHASPQPDGRVLVRRPTGQFQVHANNHGKTPAQVHHFQFAFFDPAQPLQIPPPYQPATPLRDALGPGTQSRRVRTIPLDPPGSSGRIAICGRFYWSDIWKREWSSGFVYEIPTGSVRNNDSISIDAPKEYWNDKRED